MSVRLKYFFYILLNDQRGYLGRSRGDGGKTSRHCFGEFMSYLNEMCFINQAGKFGEREVLEFRCTVLVQG